MPPLPIHAIPLAGDDVALIALATVLSVIVTCGILRFLLLSRIPTPEPPTLHPTLQTDINHNHNATPVQQRELPSPIPHLDPPVCPAVHNDIEYTQRPSLDGSGESDTSSLTSTTAMTSDRDSLCSTSLDTHVTSMTSITIPAIVLDDGDEEDDEPEDFQEIDYELKRAQTQSMEVKKGVLLSWSSFSLPTFAQSDVSVPKIPDLPSVIISESASYPKELTSDSASHCNPAFLHPSKLRVSLMTYPSKTSLLSTTSSVSVDLDQFPLPPNDRISHISIPIVIKDEMTSTLEQVITMYETEDK